MVRYGFGPADEGYTAAIAQRFVQGDRPLVDEWTPPQFSAIFLCLPYKLFVAVTGGTTGIILFFRYLFAVFNGVFYWIMYIRLHA